MNTFEISSEDLQKLKALITEFNSYYDDTWWRDNDVENDTNEEEVDNDESREWDFDDVDNQREIGLDIISIIEPLINKL